MKVKRVVAIAFLSVITPLALTGCLRTNSDVNIGSDGDIGAATIVVGVEKIAAKTVGVDSLESFEGYVRENKEIMDSDNCSFRETASEFVVDYSPDDVADGGGAYSGISTVVNGETLFVAIKEGSLVDGLPTNQLVETAVGTVMFYFEGDVANVTSPSSEYRIPSPNTVAFDLKNGKFFQQYTVITVQSHQSNIVLFSVIGLLIALLLGSVYWFNHVSNQRNPFVDVDLSATGEISKVVTKKDL
jgi:hypothetical protein